MPQTTLYFLFSDKHPTLCGGGSRSDDKRRCIKYNAATDEWANISTSLVGGGWVCVCVTAGIWRSNFRFLIAIWKKKIFIVIPFHHSRIWQFWDYNPQVGLIQAGGQNPYSISMTRSQDFGLSVETLTDIPYVCGSYIHSGCLVIVNTTTVFVAGGYSEYKSGGKLKQSFMFDGWGRLFRIW